VKQFAATMTVLIVTSVALSAQAKPRFAGHWTYQPDPRVAAPVSRSGDGRADGRSGGGRFCSDECTITQDATSLTVTWKRRTGEDQKTVYKLDGTKTTTTASAGEFTITSKTKTTWNGATLTINSTTGISGTPATTRTDVSLDANGMLRVVVTSTPPGGGSPTSSTQLYRKQ